MIIFNLKTLLFYGLTMAAFYLVAGENSSEQHSLLFWSTCGALDLLFRIHAPLEEGVESNWKTVLFSPNHAAHIFFIPLWIFALGGTIYLGT